MPGYSQGALPFRSSDQNFVWVSHLSHACYSTRLSHLVNHKSHESSHYAVIPSPPPLRFLPPRSKYFPQDHVLSHTSSICVLALMWETKFHTHTKTGNITALYILISKFLERRLENKIFWSSW
jgi:hypothetical protein